MHCAALLSSSFLYFFSTIFSIPPSQCPGIPIDHILSLYFFPLLMSSLVLFAQLWGRFPHLYLPSASTEFIVFMLIFQISLSISFSGMLFLFYLCNISLISLLFSLRFCFLYFLFLPPPALCFSLVAYFILFLWFWRLSSNPQLSLAVLLCLRMSH